MVVDLAQVIGEVGREVNQIVAGDHLRPSDRFGILSRDVRLRRSGQRRLHPGAGGFDLADQLRPRHTPEGKLRRAIPDIVGPGQPGPKVVLQVSREVQGEGAGHVGNAGHLLPQPALVGIGLDFPPKRPQVPVEDGRDRLEQYGGAQCWAPWLVAR